VKCVPPISIQRVSRVFGATRALEEITLEVETGEILGLLGPNGSGKTTLLRVLSFLIPPSSGILSFMGRAIGMRDTSFLRQMGVVFDHAVHFDHLTGYENAWFFARAYGVESSDLESRLHDLFTSFTLWERRDDAVSVYSHGMKRKLALIEALVHHPRLILLDEPSLGLDYLARMSLYQILRDEAHSGASIVLATNDVHEARLLCDRVALMNRGRLMAVGTPESLIGLVGEHAVLNVRLDRPISLETLNRIQGIENTRVVDEGGNGFKIAILARDDPGVLPALISAITPHASLLGIDVKRPDLGDVMIQFGGRN
jgi:ABC-2 type transport system ATP-binding protein